MDCPSGQWYYDCGTNGFTGCCKVDPCDRPDCPRDVESDSTTTTSSKTTKGKSSSVVTTIASNAPPVTAVPPSTTTQSAKSSSTSMASATATTITIPHPQETAGNGTASDVPSLGLNQIVGISIGACIGGIVFLIVLFLLIRRRRLSKRMPSVVDRRGDQYDEKLMTDTSQSRTSGQKAGGEVDVFKPFGGRAKSFEELPSAKITDNDCTKDQQATTKSHLSSIRDGYIVSPVSAQSTGPKSSKQVADRPGKIEEEKPVDQGPAQLDSHPLYFELDSNGTERNAVAELPTPLTPDHFTRSPRSERSGGSGEIGHPSPLTPGFPGAMLGRRPVSEGSAGGAMEASPTRLRATLNATVHEKEQNRHVTSWAHL